jgi:hypothetical protein
MKKNIEKIKKLMLSIEVLENKKDLTTANRLLIQNKYIKVIDLLQKTFFKNYKEEVK